MQLKPGKYQCQVLAPINGWFGEAGRNRTPFIRLPLRVIEGASANEEVDFEAWISDRALTNTCKNLANVFGWDGDIEALADHLTTGPFIGMECEIVVEEDTYEGKTRNVIKWLNAAGGKSMDAGAAKTLAQRIAARAKAAVLDKDKPADKAAPAKPPGKLVFSPMAPEDDDAIPFN